MTAAAYGIALMAQALLLAAVSIPLVGNRVKPNGLMGVRIPKAFESEKNWYAINHYGALQLLYGQVFAFAAGALFLAAGLAGFFSSLAMAAYLGVLALSVGAPLARILAFSSKLD